MRLVYFMNAIKQWHTVFVMCAFILTFPVVLYAQDPSVALRDENRVAEYLRKAEQALVADRLTTPEGDNALAYIEQALAIVPNDPQAIVLLKRIIRRYSERIDEASYLIIERKNTRDLVRDMIVAHVNLGERALNRSDINQALRHVELAEELALHYEVNVDNLKRFSLRLARMDLWWPSAFYKLRIVGTF
jgi:tetratricopeptide (TPR) repeat protein